MIPEPAGKELEQQRRRLAVAALDARREFLHPLAHGIMLPFVPGRGRVVRGTHQPLLVRKVILSAGDQFAQNGPRLVRWHACGNCLAQLVRQPVYVFVFGVISGIKTACILFHLKSRTVNLQGTPSILPPFRSFRA